MRKIVIVCALVTACGGKISSAGWHPRGEPPPADPPASSFDEPADDTAPGSLAPSDPPPAPSPPPPAPPCAASFRLDVLPTFDRAGCSATACHGGGSPPSPPRIDPSAPRATYDGFVTFRLSDGRTYLSGMDCNLRGTCGTKMPLGGDGLDAADLALIDAWLACGGPFN